MVAGRGSFWMTSILALSTFSPLHETICPSTTPSRTIKWDFSHTFGLSLLWASLTGLDSSSRKMRWVHSKGSNPFRFVKVQPIASSFCLNTFSNCSFCFISSWDKIITGFAFFSSRKAYSSVNGRVLSSKVGLLTNRDHEITENTQSRVKINTKLTNFRK